MYKKWNTRKLIFLLLLVKISRGRYVIREYYKLLHMCVVGIQNYKSILCPQTLPYFILCWI